MHVLHVTSNIDPESGGPAAAVVGLLRAEQRIGLRPSLVTTYPEGHSAAVASQLNNSGIATAVIGPCGGRLSRHADIRPTLERLIKGADIVHIHAVWEEIQHQAANIAREFRVPYVVRACGMLDPWSLSRNRLVKRLLLTIRVKHDLNHAAAIHYTATLERDRAAPLRIKAPAIIEPNGVSFDEFGVLPEPGAFRRRYPDLQGRPIVLFLARLHPKKGLDLLIPAFAKGAPADAALVIAGPAGEPEMARVQDMVQRSGLRDRVVITGMLHGSQRIEAMVDADLYVLPSYQENFGISVVEAMAAGCPVLISDQVNIWREVEASGAGTVVPLSVDALATNLSGLLKDRERLRQARPAAQAFARSTYDWDIIAERWNGHYKRLCTEQVG